MRSALPRRPCPFHAPVGTAAAGVSNRRVSSAHPRRLTGDQQRCTAPSSPAGTVPSQLGQRARPCKLRLADGADERIMEPLPPESRSRGVGMPRLNRRGGEGRSAPNRLAHVKKVQEEAREIREAAHHHAEPATDRDCPLQPCRFVGGSPLPVRPRSQQETACAPQCKDLRRCRGQWSREKEVQPRPAPTDAQSGVACIRAVSSRCTAALAALLRATYSGVHAATS